ncbi:TIGR02530 family flagellar biosynthesis protein [Clostridiisalibacter paucivorans]|uniref:TIGR02530 family flagellar biosynthesis protein n=1 Tax=Clostridiisalibacter paucivorans TaxID=408753 RepID=UPI00047C1306|nr:TIGR02530 family flagellar biosynthesis protein [Clostridiisalibacter paucivorans]
MDKIQIQRLNQIVSKNNYKRTVKDIKKNKNFDQILNSLNSKSVKFSKHAQQRINTRNINLSDQDLGKIENAIDKAQAKGVKEALIVMGNKAFIASVKNKTIITTANTEELKENVFTNIDGAVII